MTKLMMTALGASVLLNFCLAFGVLDRALLADDLGQTVVRADRAKSVLKEMLPRLLANRTRDEVISTANALNLEVSEEPGVKACIDPVCFHFTEGRVTGFSIEY